MKLVERRLRKLNDEIGQLRREEELVQGELEMHRHLADDALRDAAVSGSPAERVEARETTKDVARSEAVLAGVRERLAGLLEKRDRLLERIHRG